VIRHRATRLLAVLLAVWAGLAAGRAALGVTSGLRAEYFDNPDRSGTPAFTTVDGDVSTSQVTARWVGDPPPAFSVRWFGYLLIDRSGPYTFATRSDDSSFLSIDGQLVVENGGQHSAVTRTGTATLAEGVHPIFLEYTQAVGDYDIALLWATPGEALSPIPSWRLSTTHPTPWKFVAARWLDWFARAALAGLILCVSWVAMTSGRARIVSAVRTHPRTAVLLLFIALTICETWPLAAHPAALSRNDNGDTILNEWIIAWVAHQAPRAPLHLFDANIFFPERGTLAYSESMIVQSALAAPVLWAGGSPVLAYNLVLLAGFVLGGWAMSIVMARWTDSWSAGVLSGVLFAFNASVFTRLPHLQAQHVEFLPLALWALDALLREPRARYALWLAVWFTLQALTSVYLLTITAVALTAAALARPEDWLGRRLLPAMRGIGGAGLLASVWLAPFLLPYWRAYRDQGMERGFDVAISSAASWTDYLATPGGWHFNHWSSQFWGPTPLFPGVLAIALTLAAILGGVAFKNARARMALAFGVAGVVLSFGGKTPVYAVLFRVVPLLHSIRAVGRFGYLEIVSVAMLAGFGFAQIGRRLPSRLLPLIAVVFIAIAAFEPFCAPMWFVRFKGISPIYASLRDDPNAVVVEMPFYGVNATSLHAPYMLNSTANWKPMLNGYSGFQPASFERNAAAFAAFPNASSLAALRQSGVTDIFVHVDELGPGVLTVLDRTGGLSRVARDKATVHYRFN